MVLTSPLLTADGLAADWVHSHIYWTDTATNTIAVADFKGRMRAILVKDDMEEPRAIALHPGKGYVVPEGSSENRDAYLYLGFSALLGRILAPPVHFYFK